MWHHHIIYLKSWNCIHKNLKLKRGGEPGNDSGIMLHFYHLTSLNITPVANIMKCVIRSQKESLYITTSINRGHVMPQKERFPV